VRLRAARLRQRHHRDPGSQSVTARPRGEWTVFRVSQARLAQRDGLRGGGRRAGSTGLCTSYLLSRVVDRVAGEQEVSDVTSHHMVIDSTGLLLRSNRRLLAASHSLIACSRRLLNPWHGISGGGSDDILDAAESNLYQHVRTRLQHHTLPLAPKLVHARRATVERVCIVCRRSIRPGSIQHESVTADGRTDWAHTLCLRVWVDATVALAARVSARSSSGSDDEASRQP